MGHYFQTAVAIVALICLNVDGSIAQGVSNEGPASSCKATSPPEIVGYINSPRITNWGIWGQYEYCPPCTHARGFQLKVEPDRYGGDDTALNAIRLICSDSRSSEITSRQGPFGSWEPREICPGAGKLHSADFKTEPDQRYLDDTAANNVKFECRDSINGFIKLEVKGGKWGKWYGSGRCPAGSYICGLRTQVEPSQGNKDDTALNNVDFACCR